MSIRLLLTWIHAVIGYDETLKNKIQHAIIKISSQYIFHPIVMSGHISYEHFTRQNPQKREMLTFNVF